jgi:hypothetical protein
MRIPRHPHGGGMNKVHISLDQCRERLGRSSFCEVCQGLFIGHLISHSIPLWPPIAKPDVDG